MLEQANHNIKDDEEYIADKTRIIDKEFSLINAIENHITLLNSKGIKYPPEDKPETLPANLSDILNNLVTSQNNIAQAQDKNAQAQDKMINTLDKNLTEVLDAQNKNVSDLSQSLVNQLKTHTASSSKGPKPVQPKFKPKGNDLDYGEF